MRYASLMVAICLVLCGCEGYSSPATVVHWDKGSSGARMVTAKSSGQYALHSMKESKAKVVVAVQKGETLGFEPKGDVVTARAGEFHLDLPPGTYYWSRR